MGHPAYLTAKAKGNNSMPGTRATPEGVYGRLRPQDPRNMVNADLRELQSPAVQSRAPRYHVWHGAAARDEVKQLVVTLQQWAMANEAIQGDQRGTYVALGRLTQQEQGIAYGARALWQRSRRSSQRSGKPATGRRAAGNVDAQTQPRYA